MSSLLARIARTLTQHWKRGLAGAIAVVVLLGVAAGAGGEAADDFNIPGTESQQALDLFKKHSPAFAGADSTLVFTVERGQDLRPRAARRGHRSARQGPRPQGRGGGSRPVRRGRDDLARRPAGLGDRPLRPRAPGAQEAGRRGAVKAAETAEGNGVSVAERGILIDLASEQTAPVGELIGVAIAIILLTLLFRSLAAMAVTLAGALIGVDRRPDPARRAGRAARPAGVRDGDRGDARARCGHRLLALDHRPRTGTDGGR